MPYIRPQQQQQQRNLGAGVGGLGGLGSLNAIIVEKVRERVRAFRDTFYAGHRSVTTMIGDQVDTLTDVVGSGACDDENEGSVASIPVHHYDAILRLYRKQPRTYARLLRAAEAMRRLPKSGSAATDATAMRAFLARVIDVEVRAAASS